MIFPTSGKRRTSRRNTSKTRPKPSDYSLNYGQFEQRLPLTTFIVTTPLDVVDADDGLLSLREAVGAANSNEAFSDAPAGSETGDRIILPEPEFDPDTLVQDEIVLTQGELELTDDVIVRGTVSSGFPFGSIRISGENQRIFTINTTERVRLHQVNLVSGTAEKGGLVLVQPESDVTIFGSAFGSGEAEMGGAIYADSAQIRILGFSQFLSNTANIEIQSGPVDQSPGGAIRALNSDITIIGGEFSSNTAGSGGAISTVGGDLRLYEVAFGGGPNVRGNSADNGGAVHTIDTRLVTNSSFFNNTSKFAGGAIYSVLNEAHILSDSQFTENGIGDIDAPVGSTVTHQGGAIFSSNEGLFISDAEFAGNSSAHGGAISSTAEQAVFQNLLVEENVATRQGGGLYLQGTGTFISDSIISRNEADGRFSDGGGIAVNGSGTNGATAVLRRVQLTGNNAGGLGGGGYVEGGGKLRVYASTVDGNSADADGGGGLANLNSDLIVTSSSVSFNTAEGFFAQGGGIFSLGESSTLLFRSSVFSNRASFAGGGISLAADTFGFVKANDTDLRFNSSGERGGAAYVDSGRLVLVGGSVNSNRSSNIGADPEDQRPERANGGAVFVATMGQLYSRGGTTFTNNFADNVGGAIHSNGLVNLSEAELSFNNAISGGALHLGVNSLTFVSDSTLRGNSAGFGNGSAITSQANSFLALTDSDVTENVVTGNTSGPAILLDPDSFSRIIGGSIFGNTPNDDIGFSS